MLTPEAQFLIMIFIFMLISLCDVYQNIFLLKSSINDKINKIRNKNEKMISLNFQYFFSNYLFIQNLINALNENSFIKEINISDIEDYFLYHILKHIPKMKYIKKLRLSSIKMENLKFIIEETNIEELESLVYYDKIIEIKPRDNIKLDIKVEKQKEEEIFDKILKTKKSATKLLIHNESNFDFIRKQEKLEKVMRSSEFLFSSLLLIFAFF